MGAFVIVQKRLGLLDVLAVLDGDRPIALGCWGAAASEVQRGTAGWSSHRKRAKKEAQTWRTLCVC